jgi:RNA recognition motif-containing protein
MKLSGLRCAQPSDSILRPHFDRFVGTVRRVANGTEPRLVAAAEPKESTSSHNEPSARTVEAVLTDTKPVDTVDKDATRCVLIRGLPSRFSDVKNVISLLEANAISGKVEDRDVTVLESSLSQSEFVDACVCYRFREEASRAKMKLQTLLVDNATISAEYVEQVPKKLVFVFNIFRDVTASAVREALSAFCQEGNIEKIDIPMTSSQKQGKRSTFGFVQFSSINDAIRAVREGGKLNGRGISVPVHNGKPRETTVVMLRFSRDDGKARDTPAVTVTTAPTASTQVAPVKANMTEAPAARRPEVLAAAPVGGGDLRVLRIYRLNESEVRPVETTCKRVGDCSRLETKLDRQNTMIVIQFRLAQDAKVASNRVRDSFRGVVVDPMDVAEYKKLASGAAGNPRAPASAPACRDDATGDRDRGRGAGPSARRGEWDRGAPGGRSRSRSRSRERNMGPGRGAVSGGRSRSRERGGQYTQRPAPPGQYPPVERERGGRSRERQPLPLRKPVEGTQNDTSRNATSINESAVQGTIAIEKKEVHDEPTGTLLHSFNTLVK